MGKLKIVTIWMTFKTTGWDDVTEGEFSLPKRKEEGLGLWGSPTSSLQKRRNTQKATERK